MSKSYPMAIYEPSFFRAKIGTGIDARVVTDFGCALGTILPPGPVVVGRDGRPSGEHYARSIISALNSTGRTVYALGVAPTATIAHAARELKCAGAVSITPGARSASWSGLKFLTARGEFLSVAEFRRLMQVYGSKRFTSVVADQVGLFKMDYSCLGRHIQRVTEMPGIELMDINRAQFSVVLDCANSAGGAILPQFFRAIGVTVHEINSRAQAVYSHPPTLAPENFKELRAEIRKRRAHCGFGVDADGAHITLFDERGSLVTMEKLLIMAARQVSRISGASIGIEKGLLPNLRKFVQERLERSCWDAPHTEAETIAILKKKKGAVAFSAEGGIIYPVASATPDCLVSAALILSDLAVMRQTLSKVVADLH